MTNDMPMHFSLTYSTVEPLETHESQRNLVLLWTRQEEHERARKQSSGVLRSRVRAMNTNLRIVSAPRVLPIVQPSELAVKITPSIPSGQSRHGDCDSITQTGQDAVLCNV